MREQSIKQAKAIAKQFGVKGFRKLAIKSRTLYTIGKQCQRVECMPELIDALNQIPYIHVTNEACTRQMAENGFADCVTIQIL